MIRILAVVQKYSADQKRKIVNKFNLLKSKAKNQFPKRSNREINEEIGQKMGIDYRIILEIRSEPEG